MSLKKIISLFFISGIAFLEGCSPSGRYKVLSFFFDGVPNPTAISEQPVQAAADTTLNQISAREGAIPEIFSHTPYKEKKCESCHSKNSSNELIKTLPGLCISCHRDFESKYKVLHGPVASGYCLECHTPHTSGNAGLLIRKGQNLCLNCHNSKAIFKNKIHEGTGKRNCGECHNPHGGEDQFLLTGKGNFAPQDSMKKINENMNR